MSQTRNQPSLVIPPEFMYNASVSENSYTRKPGPQISPARLIENKSDFYIAAGQASKPRPKTLIIDSALLAVHWLLLEKLHEAGFPLFWVKNGDLVPFENNGKEACRNTPISRDDSEPEIDLEHISKTRDVSIDQLFIIDDYQAKNFIKLQHLSLRKVFLECLDYLEISSKSMDKADKNTFLKELKGTKSHGYTTILSYDTNVVHRTLLANKIQVVLDITELNAPTGNLTLDNKGLKTGSGLKLNYADIQKLEEINIRDGENRTDDLPIPLHANTVYALINAAPNLKTLMLSGCIYSDQSISEVKLNPTNIQDLNLTLTNKEAATLIAKFLVNSQRVGTLHLQGFPEKEHEIMLSVKDASFVELETLVFSDSTSLLLSALIGKAKKLRNLILWGASLKEDLKLDQIIFEEITDFDFKGEITSSNLGDLVSRMPNLERLTLRNANIIVDTFPSDITLRKLQFLNVMFSTITGEMFTSIISSSCHLKRLSQAKCVNLTTLKPEAKINLPEVTTIDLDLTSLTPSSQTQLLSALPNAEVVNVAMGLSNQLQVCPYLPKVKILGVYGEVKTPALTVLLQSVPNVNELVLFIENLVVDRKIENVVLNGLERLEIGSSNLEALFPLIQSAPQLKQLILKRNATLDKSYKDTFQLPELTRLDFSESNISLSNLAYFSQHCPKVEDVYLTGAYQLGRSLLMDADLSFGSLKYLCLDRSSISLKALWLLLQSAPNLTELDVQDCNLRGKPPAALPVGKLKQIDLGVSSINLSTLIEILRASPDLMRLEAENATINWDVDIPGDLVLPNLSRLDLSGIKLKKENLLAFTRLAPNVTELWVQRGQEEDDEDCCFDSLEQFDHYMGMHPNPEFIEEEISSEGSDSEEDSMDIDESALLEKNIDASPSAHGGSFHLKRIFFRHPTLKMENPYPSDYRLQIFDELVINPSVCEASEAFTLKANNDLDFEEVEIELSAHDVYAELSENENCYYGKIESTLRTDKWIALPSLSPSEKLTHLHVVPAVDVEVKYSRKNNIYFIKALNKNSKVNIDFNIETARLGPSSDNSNLPNDIRQKIDELSKFSSKALASVAPRTGEEHLKALVAEKTGACRHRAVILKQWMQENHPELNCRGVMNECHAFVEIGYKNEWFKAELGGTPANVHIDESYQPLICEPSSEQAKQDVQDKQNVSEPMIIDLDGNDFLLENQEESGYPENKGLDFVVQQAIDKEFSITEKENKFISEVDHLIDLDSKNILVNDINNVSDLLLHFKMIANAKALPLFQVNSPDDLVCSAHYVKRQGDIGEIKEGPGGPLHDFLIKYSAPHYKPIILVDFSKLSANEIVRFNQLIDEVRIADGTPVPKKALILGVINFSSPKSYKGADFTSRFAEIIDVAKKVDKSFFTARMDLEKTDKNATDTAYFELYNSDQWKSLLLGGWSIEGDVLRYKPGPLQIAIKNNKTKLIFNNKPKNNKDFDSFIENICLFGEMNHDQELLKFSPSLKISYTQDNDWNSVLAFAKASMVTLQSGVHVLNNQTLASFFGKLAFQQEVKKLFSRPGIIEAHRGQVINIYVTHTLSEMAWLQLLNEAKKHQVIFNIHKATNIILPVVLESLFDTAMKNAATGSTPMEVDRQQAAAAFAQENSTHTKIVVTNDADLTFSQMLKELEKPIIIDVTEMTVSDLLVKLDGCFDAKQVKFIFSETKGLLSNLTAESIFILTGNPNKDFIEEISPFLMERILSKTALGKLLFVVNSLEGFEYLPGHVVTKDLLSEEKRNQLLHEKEVAIHSLKRPTSNASSSTSKNKRSRAEKKSDNDTQEADAKKQKRTQTPSFSLSSEPVIIEEDISMPSSEPESLYPKNLPLCQLEAYLIYEVAFPNMKSRNPWIGLKSLSDDAIADNEISLSDSQKNTITFFAERMQQVETLLEFAPYAFLSGLTGSGKSTFILEQWKAKHPACHFGLSALKTWTTDKSDGIKTLFIDEANISQNNYTQFEELYHTPANVIIDGQRHELTPQHKVIFAGNPVSYSNDRQVASFFARHGNCILFKALPAYVLFEKIIKPILEKDVSKSVLENIATYFLEVQQFANQETRAITISPRELTTMALLTKTHKINYPFDPIDIAAKTIARDIGLLSLSAKHHGAFSLKFPKPEVLEHEEKEETSRNDKFVLTESRTLLINYLDNFMSLRSIRKREASFNASSDEILLYGGLNGFIVEGEPGIGKSEIILQQLHTWHLKEGNYLEDNSGKDCFYKIPASINLEEKRKRLLKAFNEGNVVVIDEINSCPAMEQLVNALLTGRTLEGERPAQPGFVLIGTQNPIYMPGREKQSDALERRMLQFKLPAYNQEEMKKIISARKDDFNEAEITYLMTHVSRLKNSVPANKKSPCFRDLLRHVDNVRKPVRSLSHASIPDVKLDLDEEMAPQTETAISSASQSNNLLNECRHTFFDYKKNAPAPVLKNDYKEFYSTVTDFAKLRG